MTKRTPKSTALSRRIRRQSRPPRKAPPFLRQTTTPLLPGLPPAAPMLQTTPGHGRSATVHAISAAASATVTQAFPAGLSTGERTLPPDTVHRFMLQEPVRLLLPYGAKAVTADTLLSTTATDLSPFTVTAQVFLSQPVSRFQKVR